MGFKRRITTLGAAVLTAVSLLSFPNDLVTAIGNVLAAIRTNPAGTLGAVLGLALIAWANQDELRDFLGLGRSNAEWVRLLREWSHEKRKWELVETDTKRKSFRLVFKVPMSEQNSRIVTVYRSVDAEVIAITAGLAVTDAHKAVLSKLPDSELDDLWEDLIVAMSQRFIDVSIERVPNSKVPSRVGMARGFPADTRLTELAFFELLWSVLGAFDIGNVLITKAVRHAEQGAG